MMNEPQENCSKHQDDDIKIKNNFVSKLDNFWYYHKWTLIIVIFFVVIFTVLIAQSLNKTEPDLLVVFAGSYELSNEENEQLQKLFEDKLDSDLNDDSKVEVAINSYTVFSEAEIDELTEDGYSVNSSLNSNNYSDFFTFMGTGESIIIIVSPFLYEKMIDANRLMPLSSFSSFEEEDTYGVKLSGIDDFVNSEILSAIPGDFYLCVMRSYVWGQSSNEAIYQAALNVYLNIIS